MPGGRKGGGGVSAWAVTAEAVRCSAWLAVAGVVICVVKLEFAFLVSDVLLEAQKLCLYLRYLGLILRGCACQVVKLLLECCYVVRVLELRWLDYYSMQRSRLKRRLMGMLVATPKPQPNLCVEDNHRSNGYDRSAWGVRPRK
jgi:hypothetical protein